MSVDDHEYEAVLEAIRQRDRDGKAYVTTSHIKTATGMDGRVVGRAMKAIAEAGHLEYWGGSSQSTYRITLERGVVA
ncbi:hypothetical protein ACLI4U_19185 (plasmid) [Natrialbaceae archaeon A-CW2]